MPMSLMKVKKAAGDDWPAIHALMELCRTHPEHSKGMHTNGGCACGSSVGGGQPCQGLAVLLEAFVKYQAFRDSPPSWPRD